MQPTNQPKSQKSRCIYCGSTDYGKGCRIGPHRTHLHSGNSLKCVYCGSADYGRGCRINPTADLHVHGINFNTMYRENLQSFLDHKCLLNELKKDYRQFKCYRLGLIDEQGNKLRNPITEEEQLSFTPMTKTILKLKRFLGPKIDLLNATNLLESDSLPFKNNIEYYKKLLEFQDKVGTVINELYKTLDEAQQQGLALEDLKNVLKA